MYIFINQVIYYYLYVQRVGAGIAEQIVPVDKLWISVYFGV